MLFNMIRYSGREPKVSGFGNFFYEEATLLND